MYKLILRTNLFYTILTCILFIFVIEPTFAGAPFITDDPNVVDVTHSELFLFSVSNINKNGKKLDAPAIKWDYGLIPQAETSLSIAYKSHSPKNSPVVHGASDTLFRFKYRFITETDTRPAVAFAPTVFFPTGNQKKGLGNGKVWYYLPIWILKSCDKWTTYGGGGYGINYAKGTKNYLFGGIVVTRKLDERWTLGAEIYSQGAKSKSDKSFTLLNLGGYYFYTKDFKLLFSAGDNFLGARNFVSYFGFYYTW